MIVDTYKARTMAMAMNILGNGQDAEDACQEAFIQVYRNLGRFDRRKSFRNWLFTILYRRCLDQKRKKKRFLRFLTGLKNEAAGSWRGEGSFPGEKQALSQKFLHSLSPKERAAITLWANEGYTAEEISAILGCEPSTARVYLFTARKKIRALMEK